LRVVFNTIIRLVRQGSFATISFLSGYCGTFGRSEPSSN